MKLILVRHCATEYNEKRLVQGQLTDLPLSPLGEKQADQLASILSRESITAAYSSPLGRAQETVIKIRNQFPDLQVYADTRLQEINVGIAEGCPLDELKNKFPNFWAEWQGNSDVQWPGGEKVSDVRRRVSRFLEEIKECHPHETIIAVTHATPAASLLALGLGLPLGGYRQVWLDVGCYSILESNGDTDGFKCGTKGWSLKVHNIGSHLSL